MPDGGATEQVDNGTNDEIPDHQEGNGHQDGPDGEYDSREWVGPGDGTEPGGDLKEHTNRSGGGYLVLPLPGRLTGSVPEGDL